MSDELYDVAIIGAGPAGLQAAIHAARRRVKTIVLGKIEASALYKAHLENYFGVPGKKEGKEILEIGLSQAKNFGAKHLSLDVVKAELSGNTFYIELEDGQKINSLTVIIATGVTRRKGKLKGEKALVGKGVSYCVDCDGFFFRGLPVAVIGNGSAAAHGALTLSKIASDVYLVSPKLDIPEALKNDLKKQKVKLITVKPKEILGEKEVEGLLLENEQTLEVKGVFIEEGAKGALQLATSLGVMLDPENMTYIQVDRTQKTNVPGVFAAGDVCGPPLQVAKAVGEGCIAGLNAAEEANRRRKQNEA
ncbi:FAD-dependent pyridine nucleotide-disulfide oxidoreductase [Thermodesulfatator indicus DSM 15286]|uniref:FAD-dependent pyridine nucleotide-disulfide oxidoreductase n=1 Tax=Thermodesulfatator indicus (strain DSM 15286 / JCM 11887 / CIR29812) TaxID=667014 RepID=F8A8L1_THEID|nr:FAD-dependent oxidoreductase [Thermodesulfatator indicus]AEH45097.1 FAD-dependent pyridine nucleotide-disulfide oxidoreductase [Thermodesulfatator indicus DSM 15286]